MHNRRGRPFFPRTNPIVKSQNISKTLGVTDNSGILRFDYMRNQFIGDFHKFFIDFFVVFGIGISFDDISGVGPCLKGFWILFGAVKVPGQIGVRVDVMVVIDSTIDLDGLLE